MNNLFLRGLCALMLSVAIANPGLSHPQTFQITQVQSSEFLPHEWTIEAIPPRSWLSRPMEWIKKASAVICHSAGIQGVVKPAIFDSSNVGHLKREYLQLNKNLIYHRELDFLNLQHLVPTEIEFFANYFIHTLGYQASQDAVQGVNGGQPVIVQYIDYLLDKAAQDPAHTRLVFLKAGADPLAEMARCIARVTGRFLETHIHSVWATMGNYRAVQEDRMQAAFFVRSLYQNNILGPETHRLIIGDTDSRLSGPGTEILIYDTLLNKKVMDDVNLRWPDALLPVWNSTTDHWAEIDYMYLHPHRYEDFDFILRYGLRKLRLGAVLDPDYCRMIVNGYNQMDFPDAQHMNFLWSHIDQMPKLESINDSFMATADDRIEPVRRAPYGHSLSEPQLIIAHALSYAGLLMGTLHVLEARGHNIDHEVDDLITRTAYRLMSAHALTLGKAA